MAFLFYFFFLPPPSFFFEGRKRKKGKKGICNENQSSGLTRTLQASVDWKDTRGTSSTIWHAILPLLLLLHNFGVNKQTSKTFLRDTNYETPAINLSAYSLHFCPTTVFLSSSRFQFSCLPVEICTALLCFLMTPFAFFWHCFSEWMRDKANAFIFLL